MPNGQDDARPLSSTLSLRSHGQGLWLNYLRRGLATSGELERLIATYGVSGVSLDVDVFCDVVSHGREYDSSLTGLLHQGDDAATIVDQLIAEDVAGTCEILKPLYERTGGDDGWVAVDVPAMVATRPDEVVRWWRRLRQAAGADNVMLKLSASATGIAAAEELLALGGSVYLTHVFSPAQAQVVGECQLRGLARCVAAGQDLAPIRCVAGVNLVRLDVAIDEILRAAVEERPWQRDLLESLIGRVAITVARQVWADIQQFAEGDRFRGLKARGARPMTLAWEGTRTSDPARRDVEYMEELIGPHSIVVVGLSMLAAFRDHGVAVPRLGLRGPDSREILDDLEVAKVELEHLADDLRHAADTHVGDRFAGLCSVLEGYREADRRPAADGASYRLGVLGEDVAERLLAVDPRLVVRLWESDASLWAATPEDQETVRNRLGWLHLPEAMSDASLPVKTQAQVSAADSVPTVLLGMGGSSLGADTCRIAYEVANFSVLDSTVPRSIANIAAVEGIGEAVFVVASKSGSTVETEALARYFHSIVEATGRAAGESFIAVTDPGTPLHERARQLAYRRVWLGPPDVGGRYSVLSHFGVVPMSLMGIDFGVMLRRAARLAALSGPEVAPPDNPAVQLGVILAAAVAAGRDKITFVSNERLMGFGDWAEQLIAESLGKQGVGLVPISREPLRSAAEYGSDRLFVNMGFATDDVDSPRHKLLAELRESGCPSIDIELADPHDLGREFMRWELAVAVAGAFLGLNPFDEPDVRGAKRRTSELLAAFERDGTLEESKPSFRDDEVAVFAVPGSFDEGTSPTTLAGWVGGHLGQARIPDYVAIQAFLACDPETSKALEVLRTLLGERLGVATTCGWGPRFLHSTGQLHKGGPDTGLFLQLTAVDIEDISVPGKPYSFGVLARAQALGDFQALREASRRVMRIDLVGSVDRGLQMLLEAVASGVSE